MILNYLKTAFRNLFKHLGFSLINIVGLAIGMASCLMILLFVAHETSYDGFNEHADRIHRVCMAARWGGRDFNIAVVQAVAAKTMKAEFPEIEDTVRFRRRGDYIVQYQDHSFREPRVIFADPSFFSVFSIPLLKGDPESALAAPFSAALSRKTAEKYFRDDDPLGKTLRLDNRTDYKVTGIFEEIPDNSHFYFDVMLSMESLEESRDPLWLSQNFQTYLLLRPNADPEALEAKFSQMLEKYMWPQFAGVLGKSVQEIQQSTDMYAKFYLQPLRRIHLHSDLLAELEPNSDVRYIYIFSAIALFVLIIASINFMNLATARSAGRAKEVGIRKVLGSHRRQLVRQFLTESLLTSVISVLFAVGLVWLALPMFNQLSGKSLTIMFLFQGWMPVILITMTALTGFLAGSYPAFFISAFRPVSVLRGRMKAGFKSGLLRSVLVVFQFTASIVLIVGTVVVYHQLHYIQNKNLGFDKEQVLVLDNAYLLGEQAKAFKDAMSAHSQILNATISGYLPIPSNRNNSAVFPEGERDSPQATSFQNWSVDHDYIDTLGMKILEGRNFSRDFTTDESAAVINESVARQFQWEDPVGRRVGRILNQKGEVGLYTVIGVVEDFHFESLRENIGPLVMYLGENRDLISFRLKTRDVSATVALLGRTWKEFLPGQPFEYFFLDDRFEGMYRAEQRIGRIFSGFAVLAVLIGCLGLFGLAAFTASQRTKEIGIRKVLGATAPNIVRLLMREFVILIGIANLIAWPLAYFIMRRWLQDFAYRVSPASWIFLAAGSVTLAVALFTVSFQAVKAAVTDPINSLRYE
jgi:putative ABC transport system permease protein